MWDVDQNRPDRRQRTVRAAVAALLVVATAAGAWLLHNAGPTAAAAEPAAGAGAGGRLRTLHWRETRVGDETLTTDVWLDVERGFRRDRYRGTERQPVGEDDAGGEGRLVNDGESFQDDAFATVVYHSQRHVHHWRVNPLDRLAYARLAPDDLPGRMRIRNPAKLAGVRRTGRRERVRGVDCDVWEGRIPYMGRVRAEQDVKFWTHPGLGLPMRAEIEVAGPEVAGPGKPWPRRWTMEVLEIDPALAPGYFRAPAEPPAGYGTNGPPEQAGMTPFRNYGFGGGSGVSVEQSFRLPGGSLLVGWTVGTPAHAPAPAVLERLRFGDPLPALPVKILSVRTSGAGDPEIEFDARHIASARDAAGNTVMWTLLVPGRPPPARERFSGYLVEHGPDPAGPLGARGDEREQHLYSGGMAVEDQSDFDTFVLGVMSQMSADGKAPDGLTYDLVSQLAKRPRPAAPPDPAGL